MKNLLASTPLKPLAEPRPLVALDIGARGMFDEDLLPIAWCVDAIGFEPEPEEFARLAATPADATWRSLTYLPCAISGHNGPRTLYVPTTPNSASLLKHDPAIGARFAYPNMFDCRQQVAVETRSLDDLAAERGWDRIDYIKLDIEGAELEVLQGAASLLPKVAAIKLESAFFPMRVGQPLVGDILAWAREQGFALLDMTGVQRWRTGPLAAHPYLRRADPAYSRGQIAQCDLLFARDETSPVDAETLIRTALAVSAFGFFDHARRILQAPAVVDALGGKFGDLGRALDAASRAYGQAASRRDFAATLRGLVPRIRSLIGGLPR